MGKRHLEPVLPRSTDLAVAQTPSTVGGTEEIDPETIVQEIDTLVKAGQAVLPTRSRGMRS